MATRLHFLKTDNPEERLGEIELAINKLLADRNSPYDTVEMCPFGKLLIFKICLKDNTPTNLIPSLSTQEFRAFKNADPSKAGAAWTDKTGKKITVRLDDEHKKNRYIDLADLEKHDNVFKIRKEGVDGEELVIAYKIVPNLAKKERQQPDYIVQRTKE